MASKMKMLGEVLQILPSRLRKQKWSKLIVEYYIV